MQNESHPRRPIRNRQQRLEWSQPAINAPPRVNSGLTVPGFKSLNGKTDPTPLHPVPIWRSQMVRNHKSLPVERNTLRKAIFATMWA